MPEAGFGRVAITSLADVKALADRYKVTPSAVVMRIRRLGLLPGEATNELLDTLRAEYHSRPKARGRHWKNPVNVLRAYNGAECSRRMLALLDAGAVKPAEFVRVMFSNKLRKHDVDQYRRAL